jgi:hypothetical protein
LLQEGLVIVVLRLFLKLLAAPFALALTIATALFSFALSVSERLLGFVSGLAFLGSLLLLVTGSTTGGIAFMAGAFLISPFGLPALAGWIVGKLGVGAGALRAFIFN